jgi:predicted ribosome-associated RNA-binding protein Tma20
VAALLQGFLGEMGGEALEGDVVAIVKQGKKVKVRGVDMSGGGAVERGGRGAGARWLHRSLF